MWTRFLFFAHFWPVFAFQSENQVPISSSEPGFSSISGWELSQQLHNALHQIDDLVQIGGTAGMSIGIMSHGNTILEHSFGFADVQRGVVSNSTTIYPLASLTKSFISVTIAQLVDQGILDWHEPLTSYIPELAFDADPSLASRMTLIDILSHQSGLSRLDALWLGANSQVIIPKNWTTAICNHLAPVYPLRSRWLYNNWMYALAGEVIERVTEESVGRNLAKHIFARTGLSQTTLIGAEVSANLTAAPYMILDNKTAIQVTDMQLTDGNLMASAGGVRSSVKDMLKWGHALLSIFREEQNLFAGLRTVLSGHSFINKRASSDELYALGFAKVMTPVQFGKIGFNPGLVDSMPSLGSRTRPELVFYHSGGGTGYSHCFMLLPERQTSIIVLTNSIAQGDIADWSAQTLLQAIQGVEVPLDLRPLAEQAAAKWRSVHAAMVQTLERDRVPGTEAPPNEELVGTFWHKTQALRIEVFETYGCLKFNLAGRKDQEHVLSHYHHDTFIFLPSSDERISRGLFHYVASAWLLHFKRDFAGRITHLMWDIDDLASVGEKFVRTGTNIEGM